jgi:thioredoxin:protein disulfide reductase
MLKSYLRILGVCLLLASSAALHAEALSKGISAFLDAPQQDSILPPDEAFKLQVTVQDAHRLLAQFTVAPGHYLYKERIKFALLTPAPQALTPELPQGEIKQDANLGATEVYHHNFAVVIPVPASLHGDVSLQANFQGCSEKGLCYAPMHKRFDLNLGQVATGSAAGSDMAEDAQSVQLLQSGHWWLIVAGFFVAGLLLSLTPCVLPMIPILSSIIVGQSQSNVPPRRMHGFYLSLAYTLGMALSYTLAGVLAGLSGKLLSQALQNPWVLSASALVFVLLALSMFGFYELKLPSRFEQNLVARSNRLTGGHVFAVFVMGVLSALIVSPCVAAPLAGALLYISQSHDVMLGASALFALAMGMGVPLLLLGASAGVLLPKTGPWMNTVRQAFGVVMLGMAIWILKSIMPVAAQMALWSALFVITAIYLHALDNLPQHAGAGHKFFKGVGVLLLVLGIVLLLGAVSGAKSVWQPLSGITLSANTVQTAPALPFTRISSEAELEQHLAQAAGKPVMLDFYADWCVACTELEQTTFADAKVQAALQGAQLLQVDMTANTEQHQALLRRFKLFGPPSIVFFDAQGQAIEPLKIAGYINAQQLLTRLALLPKVFH